MAKPLWGTGEKIILEGGGKYDVLQIWGNFVSFLSILPGLLRLFQYCLVPPLVSLELFITVCCLLPSSFSLLLDILQLVIYLALTSEFHRRTLSFLFWNSLFLLLELELWLW